MNWSYLAGLIDGEGSVMLNGGGYLDGIPRALCPSVAIYNNHRGVLEQAQGLMGGHIYAPRIREAGRNPSYQLILRSLNPVLLTLRKLRPELIIKQPHADLVIGFCEHRLSLLGSGKDRRYGEIDFDFVLRMRVLNGNRLRDTAAERIASRKPLGKTPGSTPHGTPTGYVYGCRCEECRNVHREYARSWRQRQKQNQGSTR